MSGDDYLLADQPSERTRLELQSRVWEPAGRDLLAQIPAPAAARAVDLGCGCLGWLRLLSEWAGRDGSVVGTDIDQGLLQMAGDFRDDVGLTNVQLVRDDLFASRLPEASFDLVHARFQIAPLGRPEEVLDSMLRLVRPGGVLVLEDPDSATWDFEPIAPATQRLVTSVIDAFERSGGCFDAGLNHPALLARRALEAEVRRVVIDLAPENPYLHLPLQFARALRTPLIEAMGADELDALLADAGAELERPDLRGRTFTLVQTVARVP